MELTGLWAGQETLVDAVVKRLMSDAPLAMLLSGGLDSSLIAAIACRSAPPHHNYPSATSAHFQGSLWGRNSADTYAARCDGME